MSAESLLMMAQAIGAYFGPGARAVIGRDTRESGEQLEAALTDGLNQQGVDVVSLGVLPTPATAFAVSHLEADFGLMITASHNPWHDNGVKLFGPGGTKISNAAQDAIEAHIAKAIAGKLTPAGRTGQTTKNDSVADAYVASLVAAYRAVGGASLENMVIAADCANGAAYQTLPRALAALGAQPVLIGVSPNGTNINRDCGSTHPNALQNALSQHGAAIGIAVDGDADRIILVDGDSHIVDGDQIMARLATDWNEQGRLQGAVVVSTVMSNLGFEAYLKGQGLRLERTAVGDRHVAQRMAEIGANLGGEPSGHLLMPDYSLAGDGTLAALMILAGLAASGQESADYLKLFDPYPQILKNVRYEGASPLQSDDISEAIKQVDESLGEDGRVLVRASGTEPVIRVMAEGKEAQLVSDAVERLVAIISAKGE